MSLRKTTLTPMLRWFAAVTLVVWIGAQVLCQTHCLFNASHDASDDTDHHSTATAPSHQGDEHQPGHQEHNEDASCLTLKSALSGNGTSPLVTPQFSLLYTQMPLALTLDATSIEPVAPFSRQAQPRDWVFTPEVCLGPAFRSLAPPFSSLV